MRCKDEYKTNDTLHIQVNSPAEIPTPEVEAYICDSASIRLLSLAERGVTFWYSSEDDDLPLGSGNSVVVSGLPPDSIFYAAVNDLNVSLGPTTKYEFDGGSYGSGYLPQPLISTEVPLVIDSARLYIGNSGTLTFAVLTGSGDVVSKTMIEVAATRNPSQAGDSDDDATDTGKMYALGLEIPEPGDYRIEMAYGDGASVFRSNSGVSGFPFAVSGIATLHGALYQEDTLTDAYYYLYDLRIKSYGCGSRRIPVKAMQGPKINSGISTLDTGMLCNTEAMLSAIAYENHTYQWLRNGEVVETSFFSEYKAPVSGNYSVVISNDQCIYSPSNAIKVDVTRLEMPEITLEGKLLVSSSSADSQWYLNGLPIDSATASQITPKIAGYYSVAISENSCRIFSDSLFVYVEPPVSDGLWLYPNPADDVITIRFRHEPSGNEFHMEMFDLTGRKLMNAPLSYLYEDIYQVVLDVDILPAGTYVLKVTEGKRLWTERLLKR